MALAGEVSVIRERLDTHERLAARKNVYSQADIEKYRPSEAVQRERDQWRAQFLERVLRILQEEREHIRREEEASEYERIIEDVSVN
jgi:hypothetical protein